jgi:hypothetical protein
MKEIYGQCPKCGKSLTNPHTCWNDFEQLEKNIGKSLGVPKKFLNNKSTKSAMRLLLDELNYRLFRVKPKP